MHHALIIPLTDDHIKKNPALARTNKRQKDLTGPQKKKNIQFRLERSQRVEGFVPVDMIE